MNKLILFLAIILSISCAKRNFKLVKDDLLIPKIEERDIDYNMAIAGEDSLQNTRYFMSITLQDTFLGGELTFTQKASFDYNERCIQYCYLLFDDQHNVYYNTIATESILDDTLKPLVPYEVGLDTLTINDAPDALQGKYFVSGDTLTMILESKEQDELVEIQARLRNIGSGSLKFEKISRKRLTFSPLYSRKKQDSKQKVFELKNIFSIDLAFHKIPSEEQQILIRRVELIKRGKGE